MYSIACYQNIKQITHVNIINNKRKQVLQNRYNSTYKMHYPTLTLLAASRHNMHKNIPIVVDTVPSDDEQISARNI
jgi:hypothetical protein